MISLGIYNPDTQSTGNVCIPENVMREVIKDLERGDQSTIQLKLIHQSLEKEQAKIIQKQNEIDAKNEELLYTKGIVEQTKRQLELCREDSNIKLEGLQREKRRSFINGVALGSGVVVLLIGTAAILTQL